MQRETADSEKNAKFELASYHQLTSWNLDNIACVALVLLGKYVYSSSEIGFLALNGLPSMGSDGSCHLGQPALG
jgi:hypothetical protein